MSTGRVCVGVHLNHLPLGTVSSHHLLAPFQFQNSDFIFLHFCKGCVYGDWQMCSIQVDCLFDYKKESSGLEPSFFIHCFSENLGIERMYWIVQSSAFASIYLLPKLIKRHHKVVRFVIPSPHHQPVPYMEEAGKHSPVGRKFVISNFHL